MCHSNINAVNTVRFITPEVITNSSNTCIQNIYKYIHLFSLTVIWCTNWKSFITNKRIIEEIPSAGQWKLHLDSAWHQCSSHSLNVKYLGLNFTFTGNMFTCISKKYFVRHFVYWKVNIWLKFLDLRGTLRGSYLIWKMKL